MNRILIVMAVVVGLVAAGATPSAAAPGQVAHTRLHGAIANAAWATMVGSDFVGASVQASSTKSGGELVIEVFHDRYDAQGNFLGATIKHAAVTSGYAFTIDKAKLDSATIDASEVPATLCQFDANWNQIGQCGAAELDVRAAWTGVGLTARSLTNDRYRYHGFAVSTHSNGTQREATATATINGADLTDDFLFANLSRDSYAQTTICLHNAC